MIKIIVVLLHNGISLYDNAVIMVMIIVFQMMKTLSYFMSTNERRLSVMATPKLGLGYQTGLYVQGLLYHVSNLKC